MAFMARFFSSRALVWVMLAGINILGGILQACS